MRYLRIAALLVALVFSVCVPDAGAQGQCIPYQADTRREAFDTTEDEFDWTMADAQIIFRSNLTEGPDDTTYRMWAEPWTVIDIHTWFKGCDDRDYHNQPSSYGFGSAVLVGTGPTSDRIFTAAHVLHYQGAELCNAGQGLAVVFGYGNYSPDQWQMTCEPAGCYVIVNKSDVYFCVEQWDNYPTEDWGVGRLDRRVAGRAPLRIHDVSTAPNQDLVIIGHPNRIPMKVEQVQLQTWGSGPSAGQFSSTGHILNHSSGSMVVDVGTKKVVGAVYSGNPPIGPGCLPADPASCYRENFASPGVAYGWAAYPGAAYIP